MKAMGPDGIFCTKCNFMQVLDLSFVDKGDNMIFNC